jgi:hypothetical protein
MANAPDPAGGTGLDLPAPTSPGLYTLRWLLAWAVLLIGLGLANRTRIGHLTIVYLLSLSILLIVLTQSRWFAWALAPLTTPGATG